MSTQDKSNIIALYESNLLEKRSALKTFELQVWSENIFNWLFCIQEECLDFSVFEAKQLEYQNQLTHFLNQVETANAEAVATVFFESIYSIHQVLVTDLQAILEFDPAAKSRSEVLLTYPGFFAITIHRIAHKLLTQGVNIIPRLLAEYAHNKTGIDINPGAIIGQRFFIDHGTGVVIGETAIIGNNVKIYQGVTLGAHSVSKDKAEKKRHPTIEDNVIIYSNATILGGKTVIGEGSVIGGNVWITESIPAKSLVYHRSEIIVKTKIEFQDILDFSI